MKQKWTPMRSFAARCMRASVFGIDHEVADKSDYQSLQDNWRQWIKIAEQGQVKLPYDAFRFCKWATVLPLGTIDEPGKHDKPAATDEWKNWTCQWRHICPWCHMRQLTLPIYQAVTFVADQYCGLRLVRTKVPASELTLSRFAINFASVKKPEIDAMYGVAAGLIPQMVNALIAIKALADTYRKAAMGATWEVTGWSTGAEWQGVARLLLLTKAAVKLEKRHEFPFRGSMPLLVENVDKLSVNPELRREIAIFCRYPLERLNTESTQIVEANAAYAVVLRDRQLKLTGSNGLLRNAGQCKLWKKVVTVENEARKADGKKETVFTAPT